MLNTPEMQAQIDKLEELYTKHYLSKKEYDSLKMRLCLVEFGDPTDETYKIRDLIDRMYSQGIGANELSDEGAANVDSIDCVGHNTRDELNGLLKPIDQPLPKCPTCGSTRLKKLDVIDRGISVGLFGFASNKVGKTFKCKNCGYTW